MKLEWIYFDKREIDEGWNINKFTNLHKILYLINPHFISFCFPVFNIAKFLSDLIRSQNQNFKNFELAFVGDSPIEKSEKIIKLFQKYYKRIKYLKVKLIEELLIQYLWE